MANEDPLTVAECLYTRSPERLWGLSPESIYTALAGRSANDTIAVRLSPHVRTETLRTNDERDREDVVEIHDWILEEFKLVKDGGPTLLGMVVLTSDEPRPLVRSIAVNRLQIAETVLRSCNEIEESLPRREFDNLLADDWDETVLGPLLGSLGFVTIYSDSVEPHHEPIKSALEAQGGIDEGTAVAEAYRRILPQVVGIEEERCLDDIVERVTGTAPNEATKLLEVVTTLTDIPSVTVNPDESTDAIDEQRKKYEQELRVLRSLLTPTTELTLNRVDTPEPVDATVVPNVQIDDGSDFLVNVLVTVSDHPEFAAFDVQFITHHLSTTPYAIYRELSSIPGVDCEVRDDGVVKFASVPVSVDGDDLREEYIIHLIERCSSVQRRIDALSDVSVSSDFEAVASDRIVAEDYASLDDGDVAPAYFTYTLVDAAALGEKKNKRLHGRYSRTRSRTSTTPPLAREPTIWVAVVHGHDRPTVQPRTGTGTR